jgi:2-hydroxy-4-carboxymuconate semialdehyde hemiacetal dehydrogenase
MDMSIQLKAANGAICTLSLSFNNDGPLGTFFRYIGDTGTYIARYDDLFNGKEEKIDVSQVDVSMNGIELQDREFFAAIREGREPNSSVRQVLPCYRCCTPGAAAGLRPLKKPGALLLAALVDAFLLKSLL